MSAVQTEGDIIANAITTQEPTLATDQSNTQNESQSNATTSDPANSEQPKMSKNALKRLRKQQEWEDGKDDRRKKRKEQRHERRARKREHRNALVAQGVDLAVAFPKKEPPKMVPVALVLDCDFEQYMSDKERISLSSQVTRAYSDNRNAKYCVHLWIAGWGGRLLERFDTALDKNYEKWKKISFEKGDFVEASLKAGAQMKEEGGEMIEPLQKSLDQGVPWVRDEKDPISLPGPELEPKEEHKDIVYLTSDSPYTLDRLEPNTSYIIGGLVDKNREKGLCYKRARERGIRTAKLPIGQFMVMQSRQVLATNHVVEIMLKWLEFEDWGKAFEAVIPKRKGGVLREQSQGETPQTEEGGDGQHEGEEDEDDENENDNGDPIEVEQTPAQPEQINSS